MVGNTRTKQTPPSQDLSVNLFHLRVLLSLSVSSSQKGLCLYGFTSCREQMNVAVHSEFPRKPRKKEFGPKYAS